MQTNFKICILALCLSFTVAFSPIETARSAEQSLVNILLQSRSASAASSDNTIPCFSYWYPKMVELNDEFERIYYGCIDAYDERRNQIDAEVQPQRDDIEANANQTCSRLSACSGYAESLQFFDCFSGEASKGSIEWYNLGANATAISSEVREYYRLNEVTRTRCTEAAQRDYNDQNIVLQTEFQNCLAGKSPVPTTSAAPTETTVENTDTTLP